MFMDLLFVNAMSISCIIQIVPKHSSNKTSSILNRNTYTMHTDNRADIIALFERKYFMRARATHT